MTYWICWGIFTALNASLLFFIARDLHALRELRRERR